MPSKRCNRQSRLAKPEAAAATGRRCGTLEAAIRAVAVDIREEPAILEGRDGAWWNGRRRHGPWRHGESGGGVSNQEWEQLAHKSKYLNISQRDDQI